MIRRKSRREREERGTGESGMFCGAQGQQNKSRGLEKLGLEWLEFHQTINHVEETAKLKGECYRFFKCCVTKVL